jgi:hypothetical protein
MFVLDSGNSTSERLWHPNATTRGTWAIYQSCIITIGLCVWQSIHLNIPPPHEAWYKQTMRKAGFALTALIAPELVAFIAWYSADLEVRCRSLIILLTVLTGNSFPRRRVSSEPSMRAGEYLIGHGGHFAPLLVKRYG